MSKILLAGNDLRLLGTRAAVLARTSANVTCCDTPDVMKALTAERYNLIVLCHSLTNVQIDEITAIVQQHSPQTKILMMTSNAAQERFYNGVEATISSEPGRLILRASELLELPLDRCLIDPVRRLGEST